MQVATYEAYFITPKMNRVSYHIGYALGTSKSLGRKAGRMEWRDYIKPIQDSDIVGGSLESIIKELFDIAGCTSAPTPETIKSWLYGGRKCKSSTYFLKNAIETEAVFRYFRKRPSNKLIHLQKIFENQISPNSDSAIDVKTTDLDIFCWSLVNQFLDLLRFERVDVPQPKGDIFDERKGIPQQNQKCCLYCVHWTGDRSIIGVSKIPTDGTCHTHSGNRHRVQSRLSSTAACSNYKADSKLMNRMKECGYDVNDLI